MDRRWGNVTKEHVLAAISKLDFTAEDYPKPRSTYLIFDGKIYPAKHIRGMAFEIANGKRISKDEYSGGDETALFLKKLGFEVKNTGDREKKIRNDKSSILQKKKSGKNSVIPLKEFDLRTLEIDLQRIKLCYLKWFYYFIPPNEIIYGKENEDSSSGKGEEFKLLRSPKGRSFTLFPTGLRWVHVGPPQGGANIDDSHFQCSELKEETDSIKFSLDNSVANLRGQLSRHLSQKNMKSFWELIQNYFWLKVGLHEYTFDTKYVIIALERSKSAREYILESLSRAEDLGVRRPKQLEGQLTHLIQYQITWDKYAMCSFDCGPLFIGKSFAPSFSVVAKKMKEYQSEYEKRFLEILAIEDPDEKKDKLRDFAVDSLSGLYDFEMLYHREPLSQIINYGAFNNHRELLRVLIKQAQDKINGVIENEKLNLRIFSFLPE